MSVEDLQHMHWAAWPYEEAPISKVEAARYRAYTAELERARIEAQATAPERYRALLDSDVSSVTPVEEVVFPEADGGFFHPYGVRSVYALPGQRHIEVIKIGSRPDLSSRPATVQELHEAPVFSVSLHHEGASAAGAAVPADFSLYPEAPQPTMFDYGVGARLFLDMTSNDFAADLRDLDARLCGAASSTITNIGQAAVSNELAS